MSSILCEQCTATCCTYIALPLDKPETRPDFDDLRWFLMHEHVSIFVEDGDWYMLLQTRCQQLQADYRCGIYAMRPRVCRTYSTENCDYHSGDYGWEQHFTSPEHIDEYLCEHPPETSTARRRQRRKGQRYAIARRLAERANAGAQSTHDRRGAALPDLPRG